MTQVIKVAHALNLRLASKGTFRGRCPACGYGNGAFSLTARNGVMLGWCASCGDQAAIAKVLFGTADGTFSPQHFDRSAETQHVNKTDRAMARWNCSTVLGACLGDIYLASRGLAALATSTALRYLGDCSHPSGGKFPALIALVVDRAEAPVGIHRTFLRSTGAGKADVTPSKASLGRIWGGAIRLDPVAPELVVGEGIETAASAGQLLGLPAWSAISAGNLATGLILPAEVRSVVIAADPDEPGLRAAKTATSRWMSEGRRVRIAVPDRANVDFNDVLQEKGVTNG